MWCMPIMEYCSSLKRNETETRFSREDVMLSGRASPRRQTARLCCEMSRTGKSVEAESGLGVRVRAGGGEGTANSFLKLVGVIQL